MSKRNTMTTTPFLYLFHRSKSSTENRAETIITCPIVKGAKPSIVVMTLAVIMGGGVARKAWGLVIGRHLFSLFLIQPIHRLHCLSHHPHQFLWLQSFHLLSLAQQQSPFPPY